MGGGYAGFLILMAYKKFPTISDFFLNNDAEAIALNKDCSWEELIARFVGEGTITRKADGDWSADDFNLDNAGKIGEIFRSLAIQSIELEPMIFGGWSQSKEQIIRFVCGSWGGKQMIPEISSGCDENTWIVFYDSPTLPCILEKLLIGYSEMIKDGDNETIEDVADCYENMLKFISMAKKNEWVLISYFTNPP